MNYNDIEVFPVLRRILEKITDDSFYKSPTDMGVNRAGFAITDDEVVRRPPGRGIRRYFRYQCEYAMGFTDKETVQRVELLLKEFGMRPSTVRCPARRRRPVTR